MAIRRSSVPSWNMLEDFWELLVLPDLDKNDGCVSEAWASPPFVLCPSEGLPDLLA